MDPILRRRKMGSCKRLSGTVGALRQSEKDATCRILVCLLRVASDFLSRSFQVNLISFQHLLGQYSSADDEYQLSTGARGSRTFVWPEIFRRPWSVYVELKGAFKANWIKSRAGSSHDDQIWPTRVSEGRSEHCYKMDFCRIGGLNGVLLGGPF